MRRTVQTTVFFSINFLLMLIKFFSPNREKEDDLERRLVLLDQELRDILAIDGECLGALSIAQRPASAFQCWRFYRGRSERDERAVSARCSLRAV